MVSPVAREQYLPTWLCNLYSYGLIIFRELLTAFLAEKRDSREYRRALAVKLALQGYLYEVISDMLDVTPGFVSQVKHAYETQGTAGLTLKYQGAQPYLSASERQAVIDWLKNGQEWSVERLQEHIESTY